jgi:hypothetical protein
MTEGREEAVRAELDHLGHFGVARVPKIFLWAVTLLNVTPAVAGFGHRDEIVSLYNALSPYAGTNAQNSGAVTFLGSYSHHLGVLATALGRWDEAERHFAEAAAMHEGMGAHVWLARTRLEWATMLAARRRPEDAERARQHVDDSLDDARRLRLPVVERRAIALRSGDGTGD